MKKQCALALALMMLFACAGMAETASAGGEEGRLLAEGECLSLPMPLDQPGEYAIRLDWYCPQGSVNPEISLTVDGTVLLARHSLTRVWQDTAESFLENGRFRTDNRGNEITPSQENALIWQQGLIRDMDGYSDDPMTVSLQAGEHTLEIRCLREQVMIGGAAFVQIPSPAPYQADAGMEKAGATLVLEAEMAARRSDAVLTPGSDRSTPSTQPNDAYKKMQNIIGGASWRYPGQWIEWEAEIAESGWYLLQFKYRQDTLRGLPAARRLYVDGLVPCAEMACLEFGYGQDWQTLIPRTENGDAIYLYLDAGVHTIRLEAILGEMGGTLEILEQAVYDLNALYRRIIMITGTSPDPYRDYYLETEIPELIDTMSGTARLLEQQVALLEEKSGSGNQAAIMHEVIRQLDSFVERPNTIQKRLDSYKNNISSLSELLLSLREQPLALDTIALSGSEKIAVKENASGLERIGYRGEMFLSTFSADYNAVGSAYDQEQSLTVWINTGNIAAAGTASGSDQAQVLKQLIDDDFVKNTGIAVNVSLVSTSDTLTQAILAGEGPDVALFVPKGTPTTLGMRGAVKELTKMPGFDQLKGRFGEASFIGYSWQGQCYALPETMSFNMLFVRTDIFEELGLSIPNTWDEFMDVTAKLQKRNLMVGIPENQQVFEALLMQRGGAVYADDLRSTALSGEAGIDAFTQWTNLYVQYGLPVSFDFFNRFRTGEMAMGIVPLTMYTQLSVAAPELKGLWQMAPIPGTVTESGLSRLESCSGTGAMIIAGTDKADAAWQFIDWWTSDDIQYRFGVMLEILIGTASRYNTANLNAFERLPWSHQELEALSAQRQQVWDTPQTPATYYITRSLTNAFRAAVYSHENPREVLEKYSHDMDAELKRKYEEFSWEGMP